MASELNGRRVAILATDGVERVELEQPRKALDGAGAQTVLLSIKTGEIAARNHDLEDAGTFTVDRQVSDARPDEFDALLLPGGTVNPDQLRMDRSAVASCGTSSTRANPSRRSATGPGPLPRPTGSVADG